MKSVDRAGAAGASFFAQSSKPGAQTPGVENWSSGNLCTANIVGFLASNASSCGPSKPLPTAKSAPFSDRSSLAVLHEQGYSIAVKTEEEEEANLAMPTREGSVGPASSLLYAVGKRTSSQAFSGDAASMQIYPTLPRRPRWLSALAVGLSEDMLGDHPHGASSQQPVQVPSFLHAVGHASTEFQPSQEVLEQLPEVMGAAILTECQSSGDIRGRCPESISTVPAAPASMCSVLSGLSIGSSGTLSALLSATSPAVLEQLIAAALTGRTAASTSATVPDQVQASLAAASICSPEGVGGVAMRSKSSGSQYVHPEESQFAGPELTRRLQGGPDAGLDLSSRVSASTVKGREHLSARIAAKASEAAKGSASGSADDVSLTAPVSGQAATGGSGLNGEAGCGGVKDDDGRGCENGIESTVSNLGGPGHSGNSDSVPSGFIGTGAVLPAPAAVLQPSIAWDFSARAAAGALAVTAPNLAGESAAGPAAQRASAAPPDPPLVQASVPVSAQLGAAIPPELAARLKKPVRIIQPISQTWVEETLQCGRGVTRPPGSSNSRAGATAASTRGKQCPPSAPVGSDIDPKVSHCCGSGMTTVPTAGSLPSRGTVAVVRKLGPSERLVSAPQSPKPDSAAAMSAQPVALHDPALRCTPARVTRLLAVEVGKQAQQTAPQPSWDIFKPRTPVAPSTGEQPPQLTALAPAMATMPLADNASPFTACSAALLLPPQQQATSAPTGGSAVAAMLPPTYDSNATTVSATWTVGTSPFSSSFGPGASGDAAVADPGPVGAADADAGCGASATAAPHEDAGPIAPGLDAPTSGRTIAALLGGSVPAGLQKPSRGVARSQSDRFRGPLSLEGLVAAQLPQQPAPALAPLLPQRQPSASTGTASASRLGKVQGELTLLYQWYTANKAVYLDQAQRQLQRAEVLTAAHAVAASGGNHGGDAASAASAKAEFGEAMRAFETAHNIMRVCGRVEQQWQSAAGLAGAGTDWRQLQVAAPPLTRQGSVQPEADASRARLAVDMALDASAMDQAIHGPSAASAQLPTTTGRADGASAALEVAAALVESVLRDQRPARGPSGMAPGGLAEQPAGAGPLPQAVRWDAKRRPVVGSGPLAVGEFCPQPTIGLPLFWAAQGPLKAAGTAAACASWPPPAAPAVAPPPAAPTMVAPLPLVIPPSPSPTTAAATLPPPIGSRSQATPA